MPDRSGVAITDATATKFEQMGDKMVRDWRTNEPTFKLQYHEYVIYPEDNDGEWLQQGRDKRSGIKYHNGNFDPPDADPLGYMDIIAQEKANWDSLDAWYGEFMTKVRAATGESATSGENDVYGLINNWDTWNEVFKDSAWTSTTNPTGNKFARGTSWPRGSGWVIPAPAERIFGIFKGKDGVEPQSDEVGDLITASRTYWQKLWDSQNAELASMAEDNRYEADFDLINRNGKGIAKATGLSGQQEAVWWNFPDIYFSGAEGNMNISVPFDDTLMASGATAPPGDFEGGPGTVVEYRKNVFRGPPDNLPILYGLDGKRTQATTFGVIRHTSKWTGKPGEFSSPQRFVRGFIRGPYGAGAQNATYTDGSVMVEGGHTLYFHYNPNLLDMQLLFTNTIIPENQQDEATTTGDVQGYSFSYSLLLDRTQDLFEPGLNLIDPEGFGGLSGLSGSQRTIALDDAYLEAMDLVHKHGMQGGSWDIAPVGESPGAGYGVLKDVAVLRSILMMNEAGRGAGALFISYFGPGWQIYGHPVSAGVQFTHFSRHMVPTRCVVTLQIQQVNPNATDASGDMAPLEPFVPPGTDPNVGADDPTTGQQPVQDPGGASTMSDPSESRYAVLPTFAIQDARRGMTKGRIPRRTLLPSGTHTPRLIPYGWAIEVTAHRTQGSMYAWWKIMDTNPEYLHPWDISPGDVIRLPTLK